MEIELHLANLELMIGVFIVLALSTFPQLNEATGKNTITEL